MAPRWIDGGSEAQSKPCAEQHHLDVHLERSVLSRPPTFPDPHEWTRSWGSARKSDAHPGDEEAVRDDQAARCRLLDKH